MDHVAWNNAPDVKEVWMGNQTHFFQLLWKYYHTNYPMWVLTKMSKLLTHVCVSSELETRVSATLIFWWIAWSCVCVLKGCQWSAWQHRIALWCHVEYYDIIGSIVISQWAPITMPASTLVLHCVMEYHSSATSY